MVGGAEANPMKLKINKFKKQFNNSDILICELCLPNGFSNRMPQISTEISTSSIGLWNNGSSGGVSNGKFYKDKIVDDIIKSFEKNTVSTNT